MPFNYMPQQFWGGLTGVDQAMQPIIDALNHRMSLQGRMERQIAQDPHTWYNKNLGEIGAGAPRRFKNAWEEKLFVDPTNYGDFAFQGVGQPVKPDMVPRDQAQDARSNEYLQRFLQMQDNWNQGLFNAFTQQQQNQFPADAPVQRREEGGPVDEPTKSQLEQFLELLGIEREGIPIVAHPGEYVLNKEATQRVGKDKLDQLNEGAQRVPRMKDGGSAPERWWETPQSPLSGMPSYVQPPRPVEERVNEAYVHGGLRTPHEIAKALQIPMGDVTQALESLGVPFEEPEMRVQQGSDPTAPWNQQRDENPRQRNFPDPSEGRGGVSPIPQSMWPRGQQPSQPVQGTPIPFPPEYTYRRPEAQPPTPPPAPTPPDERVIPEREESVQPDPVPPPRPQITLPAPQQQMPPIYGRAHNQMPNIPWERIQQMEPGQAMQVLQQYANTQSMGPAEGLHSALNSSGPAQMGFMEQLMNQYLGGTQAEGAKAQTQGQQIQNRVKGATAPDLIKQAKLETQRVAAMSPYFEDLAKLTIDEKTADVAYKTALAENAHKDNTVNFMQLKPQDVMQMGQRAQDIWQNQVSSAEETVRQAQQLYSATEGDKNAEKALAKAQLRYQLLTENLPLQTPWEQIELADPDTNEGLFSLRDNSLLTKEEVDQIKSDVLMQLQQRDRLFNQVEQFGLPMGTGGMSGMNFWGAYNQQPND